MSIEDVDQAVFEGKFSSAEVDVPEVIARMLGVPRDLVVRVRAAFETAEDTRLTLVTSSLEELPQELRTAYATTVRRGIIRMKTRRAIQTDDVMYVSVRKLVKKPEQVCRGCPFSIRCVTQNITTSAVCYERGPAINITDENDVSRIPGAKVVTKPVQIRGDKVTVECAHPLGTYVLDVGDFLP